MPFVLGSQKPWSSACTRAGIRPLKCLQPGVPCLATASPLPSSSGRRPEGLTAARTLVAPAQSSRCSAIDRATWAAGPWRSPTWSMWARDPRGGQSPRGQREGLEEYLHPCSGRQLPDGGEVHSMQTPFHGRAGREAGPCPRWAESASTGRSADREQPGWTSRTCCRVKQPF